MNEDEIAGKARQAAGSVRGRVRDIAAEAPAAAREVVATGRDYARRGAFTITRVATDNTALTALVAGAAVAAVGWLLLGRRRGEGDGRG